MEAGSGSPIARRGVSEIRLGGVGRASASRGPGAPHSEQCRGLVAPVHTDLAGWICGIGREGGRSCDGDDDYDDYDRRTAPGPPIHRALGDARR